MHFLWKMYTLIKQHIPRHITHLPTWRGTSKEVRLPPRHLGHPSQEDRPRVLRQLRVDRGGQAIQVDGFVRVWKWLIFTHIFHNNSYFNKPRNIINCFFFDRSCHALFDPNLRKPFTSVRLLTIRNILLDIKNQSFLWATALPQWALPTFPGSGFESWAQHLCFFQFK